MIVNLTSDTDPRTGKPRYTDLRLSNEATIEIRDELARLPGVGDVSFLGQRIYSMRVWVNPDRMANLNLTADDLVQAVQEQNVQVAAGQIGQQPVPAGQDFQLTISTLGRLVDPDQFGSIIVKTGQGGRQGQSSGVVYMRDVARIDAGAQQYDQSC